MELSLLFLFYLSNAWITGDNQHAQKTDRQYTLTSAKSDLFEVICYICPLCQILNPEIEGSHMKDITLEVFTDYV
tara:strand:+ start:1908 stop:2132 length:225 start_codon:yes stop_codon:yes gene_type:complete